MRFAVLVLLALVGCAGPAPTYHWSSTEGRSCVKRCTSSRYQCQSQCSGGYACLDDCARAEWACAEACGDVEVTFDR